MKFAFFEALIDVAVYDFDLVFGGVGFPLQKAGEKFFFFVFCHEAGNGFFDFYGEKVEVGFAFREMNSDGDGFPGIAREILVKNEVPERINDESVVVFFDGLDDVRMMADDDIGSSIDKCVCEIFLPL